METSKAKAYKQKGKNKMKKIIILLITISSIYANGIMGVELGGNLSNAVKKLNDNGLVMVEGSTSKDTTIYHIEEFASYDSRYLVIIHDVNNVVVKVAVMMSPNYKISIWSDFDKLSESLSKKYIAGKNYETYVQPYKKNDGYTHQAMRLNKLFKSAFFSNDAIDIVMRVRNAADSKFTILLAYEHKALFGAHIDKNKKLADSEL